MDCIDHGRQGNRGGYAATTINRQYVGLHRLAYCEAKGIPLDSIKGLVIRHTCDNTRCINPEHLVLGTQQQNVKDMVERQRNTRHEAHPKSVLTVEKVRSIRLALAEGLSLRTIARQYGINHNTVDNIKHLRTWVDINGEPL